MNNSTPHTPDLINRKEAAQLLGVSLGSLHRYTAAGIVQGYKIGPRTLRYKRSEIANALQAVTKKEAACNPQ